MNNHFKTKYSGKKLNVSPETLYDKNLLNGEVFTAALNCCKAKTKAAMRAEVNNCDTIINQYKNPLLTSKNDGPYFKGKATTDTSNTDESAGSK